ncbi:hypothetical protein VPH35_050442 [Triticum aestivum]
MENNKVVKVLGPEDPKIKRKRKTALMAATEHSKQSTLDKAAPTLTMNHKETRQGWHHGDHRTSHLTHVIVYQRPPTAASTSQHQAVEAFPRTRRRRADYHDQSRASDVAHHRHRCHRSHRARPVVGSTKGIKFFKTAP